MIEYIKNNKLNLFFIILTIVIWTITLTTTIKGASAPDDLWIETPIGGGGGVHTHTCGGCSQNIIDCFINGCVCGCQCSGGCTHPSPLCTSPITSCTCSCRDNPQNPPPEYPTDPELISLLTAILYMLFNSNYTHQQIYEQLSQLYHELTVQTEMIWTTQTWSIAIAAFSTAAFLFLIFAIVWSRAT